MSLTVSICVIAYNEENTISGILSDILYQTYPHKLTQIVLVNSRSEDNTQKIMEQFANSNSKNYISIDILENNKRSQASGWNTALKKAIGDVIIRVDAHASIPKDFIEKNINVIESGENISGGSRPNIIIDPTPMKETLLLAESSMFGSSIASYRRESNKKQYVDSMFHAAYRREVFENVGGFDETLGRTEDNELHYRMRQAGYKFCLSPDIPRQHPARRGAEHRQQLFGGFPDIVFVARNLAAGTVVDAIHHQTLEGLRVLHFYRPPEREALRVSEILPEHIVAGAVRLVLHIAQHFVQHGQLVFLIDQKVFVGEAHVLFSLKRGIRWIGVDDIRPIDQLFVTGPARRIVAGNGCLG